MNRENTFLSCLGLLVWIVFILVVGSVYHGWVLTILWKWFVVPVFQVPELSIVYAIGITLVVSLFKSYEYKKSESKETLELIIESLFAAFLPSTIVLLVGWIVTLFL